MTEVDPDEKQIVIESFTYLIKKQEAHGPHRSPENHICP